MSPVGILLIVACLIADMATPLCPGAFRFDPAQSIEGVTPRASAALPSNVEAPSLPRHDAFDAAWSHAKRLAAGDLVARLPLRRMVPRVTLGPAHLESAPPRSSEDG